MVVIVMWARRRFATGGNPWQPPMSDQFAPSVLPHCDETLRRDAPKKAARMITFYEGDTINAPAVTTMLTHIIATNRARRSRS
jgi:hypothetical protein